MYYAEIKDTVLLKLRLLTSEDEFIYEDDIATIANHLDVDISIKDAYGHTIKTISTKGLTFNDEIITQVINLSVNLEFVFVAKVDVFCGQLLIVLENKKICSDYYNIVFNGHYICEFKNDIIFPLTGEEIVAIGSDCRSILTYNVISTDDTDNLRLSLWRDGKLIESEILSCNPVSSDVDVFVNSLKSDKIALEMLKKIKYHEE